MAKLEKCCLASSSQGDGGDGNSGKEDKGKHKHKQKHKQIMDDRYIAEMIEELTYNGSLEITTSKWASFFFFFF